MESNPSMLSREEDSCPAIGSDDCAKDSTKSFHLDFDDQAAMHLVNFYEPESVEGHSFRWSEPVAMVRLDVPASDYEITIETGSLRCGGLSFPFRIFWNDQRIDKKHVRLDEGKIVFKVSRAMFIRNDEQRLTFSCKPLRAEKGRRQLGLPIKWIHMEQTGAADPEFANPTKTRSRFWRRDSRKLATLRKLVGIKSPSPSLPIWEMKLPNVSTSLRGQTTGQEEDAGPDSDLVIVSSVEINSRHGTGLLIQYMFKDFSQITTVSSQRCFHGDRVRSARHFEVPFQQLERHQIYELVLNWFKSCPPKRAYIVPYYQTELIVAIALRDLFGTEICLHVMDDQCLYEDEIPFALMQEALDKSVLTFVISPEMRDAYQERFQTRIYILPPVVPENMIGKWDGQAAVGGGEGNSPDAAAAGPMSKLTRFLKRKVRPQRSSQASPSESERGIIIGNIWDEKWLENLQVTVRNSGFEVDWYSNNPDAIMLSSHKDKLISSGIHLQQPLWSEELVNELRRRPYAIMPTGMLSSDEKQESLARLSLPSRLPFFVAVSQIPIIVMGSPATAAARFVERFSLGKVVDYEHGQFQAAVESLLTEESQAAIRSRASALAPSFSARDLASWIDDSIGIKQPIDNRFETLFDNGVQLRLQGRQGVCERRANWNKEQLWQLLGRLKKQGIHPDHVVDVGAGDGAWSWTTSQIFPQSNYLLVEPLLQHYNQSDCQQYFRSLNSCDVQQIEMGSSSEHPPIGPALLTVRNFDSSRTSISLDELAAEKQLQGSVLLKIESTDDLLRVLAGGRQLVGDLVDVMIVTLDLSQNQNNGKSYSDYLAVVAGLGFQLVDESDAKRCPSTDMLLSKNLVFVKREICEKRMVA